MLKRILYTGVGFAAGVLFILSVGETRAQFDQDGGGFQMSRMSPPLPGKFGKLVAVSGIDMYFMNDNDGTVYLVHPKTGTQLDTTVTMVPRS